MPTKINFVFCRQALFLFLGSCALLFFSACGSPAEDPVGELPSRTPVTATTIQTTNLTSYLELNATSQFLQKNYVKANVNGYLQQVNISLGSVVAKGQVLFVLKTKEAQSIGNAINKLDPSFRFFGINTLRASSAGFVAQLTHQSGDYVQDGEQLAVINEQSSFAFILNLPFEYRAFLPLQKAVTLFLPDSSQLQGRVTRILPTVDPATQTQQIVIEVADATGLPENLIARVRIVKTENPTATALPKEALLSNEDQSEWWVMKLLNDSTAVKVPVQRGTESGDFVEVLSPQFSLTDRILTSGNYGLNDTAAVLLKPNSARP